MSTQARFRRSLLGYCRREVDRAVEERDAELRDVAARLTVAERTAAEQEVEVAERGAEVARVTRRIEEIEQVANRLAERVVERERALRELRGELERARERGDEGARALALLAEDLRAVRSQARGQATRMRLRALREAAAVTERIGELRSGPDEMSEGLIDALQEAVARVGAEAEEEPEDAVSNGHRERRPSDVFDGLVEVDVGPLGDFSQLVGFEDAAAEIGATSEVSVKRFARGRATLAMRFKHPVELLRELEERAPFEFRVRDTRSDRIVLDVDE
jgi:hypothetical protein